MPETVRNTREIPHVPLLLINLSNELKLARRSEQRKQGAVTCN
jgi:hypothetical protein